MQLTQVKHFNGVSSLQMPFTNPNGQGMETQRVQTVTFIEVRASKLRTAGYLWEQIAQLTDQLKSAWPLLSQNGKKKYKSINK